MIKIQYVFERATKRFARYKEMAPENEAITVGGILYLKKDALEKDFGKIPPALVIEVSAPAP